MARKITAEIIGKRFGKLTVLAIGEVGKNYHRLLHVRCDCGVEKKVLHANLVRGATRSCGCTIAKGDGNRHWIGVGNLSGSMWALIKKGARDRQIEVKLTHAEAWELFQKQGGLCALTGALLTLPEHCRDYTFTASLDRIDSSKPYVKENVQWVTKHVNLMKRSYSQEEFIDLCRRVVQFQESKSATCPIR